MPSRTTDCARAAVLSSMLAAGVGIGCTTEVVRFGHREAGVSEVRSDANLPADFKQTVDALSPSGTGFSRYVQYACCKPESTNGCVKDVAGGTSSCESGDTWKTYVAQKCKEQGMTVVEFSVYGDCSPPSDQVDSGVDAGCFTTENQDKRCTICGGAFACEALDCKPIPDDPSGTCQSCHWSDHPLNECTTCIDSAGNVLKDSCHGQLSTP